MSISNDPAIDAKPSTLSEFLNFRMFVFPVFVKWIFILVSALLPLFWLVFTVFAFTQGASVGLGALLLGVFVVPGWLLSIRIWCELTVVMFRIYDELRNRGK